MNLIYAELDSIGVTVLGSLIGMPPENTRTDHWCPVCFTDDVTSITRFVLPSPDSFTPVTCAQHEPALIWVTVMDLADLLFSGKDRLHGAEL